LTEKELRPGVVRDALEALLRPRGPLGPNTANKVQATGRRIIREALFRERWTGHNPFAMCPRQREVKRVFRSLSLAEVRQLLPHLCPDRRRQALVMLYTAIRPGEMKALRKVDVDFLARTLVIRRSNGRDTTKTGVERIIPIPHRLLPILKEAIAASPPDCPLVFPGRRGRRQRDDAKLGAMLRAALRRAGLPLHVRFYDLRHSSATLHRKAGADPLAVELVLGHTPKSTTEAWYVHFTEEDIRRELNKLRI
jgi:integrase